MEGLTKPHSKLSRLSARGLRVGVRVAVGRSCIAELLQSSPSKFGSVRPTWPLLVGRAIVIIWKCSLFPHCISICLVRIDCPWPRSGREFSIYLQLGGTALKTKDFGWALLCNLLGVIGLLALGYQTPPLERHPYKYIAPVRRAT